MVEIDGSDGGGQVLRTSLTLSMLTGERLELSGIRAQRPDPGLKPQHLTAVESTAAVCDATVDGATLGATSLTFEPGDLRGGTYRADIGTAGSLTLLFDALLPVATRIDESLALRASGGTDVQWSPPMAFVRRLKLPVLRNSGLGVAVDCERRGFYPAGGGAATLHLFPSSLSALSAPHSPDSDADRETTARVYSTAAASLSDADVAQRQADAAVAGLEALGIGTTRCEVTEAETASPGSVVVVRLDGPATVAGFDAYGERGVPAEDVAASAVEDAAAFHASGATASAVEHRDRTAPAVAVDERLADQLLFVLALAGGRLVTPRVTDHVRTSVAVFEAFGYDVGVEDGDPAVIYGR